MRILVTNDDGVHAPGLAVLARALADAGHDVIVVAPATEASGAGAGVGPLHVMGGGINVEAVEIAGLEDLTVLGADALPALIVITACLGAYGAAPDLVVAGINPGRNVGRAVLHSGTVGAALTSVHFARRGLAVSIQSGPVSAFESAGEGHIHFATAAAIAVVLAEHLEAAPPRTVLNCNAPNLPLDQVAGIRRAHLATTGLIQSAAATDARANATAVPGEGAAGSPAAGETADSSTGSGPSVRLELGFKAAAPEDESDEALTTRGYAVVTPLASVTEDRGDDVALVVETALGAAVSRLGIAPPA